jgi:CDP-paratose 2-epimerase
VKCTVTHTPYVVFGYGGKQVRDKIRSFRPGKRVLGFFEVPRADEVYNIGGGSDAMFSSPGGGQQIGIYV